LLRKGIGDLLAEGTKRVAEKLGGEAVKYSVQVKGQEVPMHEPRLKRALGVGYAVSPTGADHIHNMHDTSIISEEGRDFENLQYFGLLEPLQLEDLGPKKIQALIYWSQWRTMLNCIGMCAMLSLGNTCRFAPPELTKIVRAVTGWKTSTIELMKMGRRVLAMVRVFNLRESFTAEDDWLPPRFFQPTTSGPLSKTAVDPETLRSAVRTYYETMGWDRKTGVPTRTTLEQLDIGWAVGQLL